MAKCRSCKTAIRWVRMSTGGNMPLDVEPTPGGNIMMVDGLGVVVKGDELEDVRAAGERLWMPHWATCKYSKRHRSDADRTPARPPDPQLPI